MSFLRPLRAAWLAWTACCGSALAWTPADLDLLTSQFATLASQRQYQVRPVDWVFPDPADCFDPEKHCYFSNPDGPYGFPHFNDTSSLATRLNATEALVYVLETPPSMRYFGFTSYLFARHYDALPHDPSSSGVVQVYASLNDTLNLRRIRTTGSTEPGQNVFSQLSVVVVTADSVTAADVQAAFTDLGYPADTALNLLPLPVETVPLKMGRSTSGDLFSALLRMAYPASSSALSDYIARAPVRVLRLSPGRSRDAQLLPTPRYQAPGSGQPEAPALRDARDDLARRLVARYALDYEVTELRGPIPFQTRNYTCVAQAFPCNGDNPDAIYTRDVNDFIPSSRKQKVLVVGVNHTRTGKTTYMMHAASSDEHHAGVLGTSDEWLTGSAQALAGAGARRSPHYPLYDQLYAFTVGYDCSDTPGCRPVPEPSADNPVGVPFGQPVDLTARYYLDPVTQTRPHRGELIPHRLFLLTPRHP